MSIAVRTTFAAAAIATVFVFTGCVSSPPATTPTPNAADPVETTPSVEPEPVDPMTTATEIVVRPEQLEFMDAAGTVVATVSYDAEASEMISALTTVAGAAPAQADYPAGMETPARTEYTWPGIKLSDDHEELVSENGLGGYGSLYMNVSVTFTEPTVGNGVVVRTVNGFQAGGDAEALAAELGEPWYGNGYDQVRVETGEPIGEQNPGHEYENAYSVAVNTWEHEDASNVIFAPWNFGIGHV